MTESDTAPAGERRAAALVALAHESLVDARTATLLVEGLGRVGREVASITLCERGGRPVLLCPAASVLAEAVGNGCTAVLSVPTGSEASIAGTVNFLGRLHTSATYGAAGERTAMLELAPASIVVEHDAAPGERSEHEDVDLTRYTAFCARSGCRDGRCPPRVDADHLAELAERIRVHTNHQHVEQLVEAVIRLAAVDPASIAGARLAELDGHGAVLDWTDEAGGHRLALSFPAAAEDPATLARYVREALAR